MGIFIETIVSGPLQTNGYLVWCDQTKKGVIIDAPLGSKDNFLKKIEKNQVEVLALLLTHSHWDHTADAYQLQQALNLPVWVHQEDRGNVVSPGSDGLPSYGLLSFCHILPIAEPLPLTDQQVILIGNVRFVVLHTPGHSPGSCCFYAAKEGVLFSGDTLFAGTMGRLDMCTGEPARMWVSLRALAALPPATVVYPGHGIPTDIASESWLEDAERLFGH